MTNEDLNGFNSNLNSLQTKLNEVWSSEAATAFDSSLSETISAINELYEQINIFYNAVEKVEKYKANKEKIAELEQKIAYERANPSFKTTETYIEDGEEKTRIIYVVNQNLIDEWQAQINALVAENNQLRSEIHALLDSIVPVNITPKNNSDIAHRGYRPHGVEENSAEAFKEAGKNGFWGCEADVRFDSDGNLVCSHNEVETGQNPTSFEEYLDICKEYGMTPIIDLKYIKGTADDGGELSQAILKTLQEKGMTESSIIQTNNRYDISHIRGASEEARIWYLTDVVSDENLKLIEDNNVECVNIQTSENNAYRINKLTENGVDVCVWNVQTETTKERLLDMGAKYVMSDNVLGITPYQEGEEDFNGIET